MPVDAMADLLDEHDTRLWRVLMHYVQKAHAKSDWSALRRIAVDETSARRGHRYVTTVLDAENARLLLMVEGRSAEALGTFANALREHGGDPSQIEAIAMDMSPAYVKGATQYFAQARIVFDKFHLMVLSGQALDEVRRELQREGADLKGAMWSLRGNAGLEQWSSAEVSTSFPVIFRSGRHREIFHRCVSTLQSFRSTNKTQLCLYLWRRLMRNWRVYRDC